MRKDTVRKRWAEKYFKRIGSLILSQVVVCLNTLLIHGL